MINNIEKTDDLSKMIDDFRKDYIKKHGRLLTEQEVIDLVEEAKRERVK